MGLFPNATAWPRNGTLEGMYGGYFCKERNKSVNDLYGLNISCLTSCARLTYRVLVAGLAEPQLGNVSEEEGDEGGSQKHGGQVLVHFVHRVAEQSAAHFIQMHGHFSAFTFFWILPGSCKWLKTLTATRCQRLPFIWRSCLGGTYLSTPSVHKSCPRLTMRGSLLAARRVSVKYPQLWLAAGTWTDVWLYDVTPASRVRSILRYSKLVLDGLGGLSLRTQQRIRDVHQ